MLQGNKFCAHTCGKNMPRELKTVASNLTFSLISGSLIDLKVSSNDVKHITRVDCLYVQPSKVCFKLSTNVKLLWGQII